MSGGRHDTLRLADLNIPEHHRIKHRITNSADFTRKNMFEPRSRDKINTLVTKQPFQVNKTIPLRVYKTEPPQQKPHLLPPNL